MKRIRIFALLGIVATSMSCPTLLDAQLSAPVSSQQPKLTSTLNSSSTTLNNQIQKPSTQKVTRETSQSQQKPKLKPNKVSKPDAAPKLKLISKKQFKEYLKTALTVLGVTGTIILIVSKDALDYFMSGISQAVNGAQPIKSQKATIPNIDPQSKKDTSHSAPTQSLFTQWRTFKTRVFPPSPEEQEQQKKRATMSLFAYAGGAGAHQLASLIENKANINDRDKSYNCTPLFYAARHNNTDAIQELLRYKANIETTSERDEDTALMEAVKNNHLTAIRILIKKGAQVNAQNRNGVPALHYAIDNQNTAIVQLLLNNNADPRLIDNRGRTALIYGCTQHYPAAEIVTILLSNQTAKENINRQDINGRTALAWAIASTNVDRALILLKYGADPNIADTEGGTPFMRASARGHIDLVNLLLDYKADPLATNNAQVNALMKAALCGKREVIPMLLTTGIPIDAVDNNGETALMYATENKNLEIVQVLLDNKANPNMAEYKNGWTPLHFATSKCAFQSSSPDYCAITQALLKAQADIHAQSSNGKTPLHCAAYTGCADTIKLLRDSNANINAQDHTDHVPADYARIKAIKRLFDVPEDQLVNVPDTIDNSDSEDDDLD